MLQTHCCRHKCFPVCPCVQRLLRTQILCPGHKNVSDFVQKCFVSATNVSQFAQPKKHHGQQCVLVYQGQEIVFTSLGKTDDAKLKRKTFLAEFIPVSFNGELNSTPTHSIGDIDCKYSFKCGVEKLKIRKKGTGVSSSEEMIT